MTSTLISARAGDVARDQVLYSPKKPDAAILAAVESVAKNPVQQRMSQVDVSCSHDDLRALLAHRARLPSQQWRANPF